MLGGNIALLGFLLAAVASAGDVIQLTQANFDEQVAGEITLVKFFAPQCPKCIRLAPDFEKAAGILRHSAPRIALAEVDASTTDGAALAQRFGVSSYPTLYIFRLGVPAQYYGPRQAEGIARFMREQATPSATPLATSQAFDDWVRAAVGEVSVVGFFSTPGDKEEMTFQRLAAGLRDDYRFGAVTSPDVIKERGNGREGVFVMSPYESEAVEVPRGSLSEMKKQLLTLSVPLVGVYETKCARRYDTIELPRVMAWAALKPNDKSRTKWVLNRLRKAAEGFKGKLVFAVSYRDWDIDYENSKVEGDPEIVLGVVHRGKKYRARTQGALTVEAVTQVANDFLQGKLSSKRKLKQEL